MTIYRKTWYPDVESHHRRQVRCNPATDTLLVIAVPSYPSEQRHPSLSLNDPGDLYHQGLEKWFPQNADIFTGFRYLISRFRHVVFSFLSDFETPGSLFSGAFDSTIFKQFLIFFECLEHLYLCSDPENLTAVREWKRVEDIENLRDGSMDNMDWQNFFGASSGVLNCDYDYHGYMRVQSELSADSGNAAGCRCRKVLEGVGCFAPVKLGSVNEIIYAK